MLHMKLMKTVSQFESFFTQNIIFLLTGIAGFMLLLVSIRIMRQTYLGNALQVEYGDCVWLRNWSNKVAKDLEMPEVEIMVTQDPVMNAFAFGFMKPYTIVLNSGLIHYCLL